MKLSKCCLVASMITFLMGGVGCQTFDATPTESSQVEKEKDRLETQREIVINYLNRGEPERALKEVRPMLAERPEDADLLSLMGLTQMALRNPARAGVFLEKAYQVNPSPTTALNLSSSYLEQNQPQKAITLLSKLFSDDGVGAYDFPERLYHNLGLAYEKLRKYQTAEINYRKALEDNPVFYLTLMQLGLLNEKMRRPLPARQYFLRARKVCMKCYEPVAALANNYIQSNQADLALSLVRGYQQRKDLNPNTRLSAQRLVNNAIAARDRSAKSKVSTVTPGVRSGTVQKR